MKLRNKYILFIILSHLSLAVLTVVSLKNYPAIFFLGEFLIIVSVGFSIYLYQAFVHPLDLIKTGIQLFKDKDFSTKLAMVGEERVDEWVEMYNRMQSQLNEERIKLEEKNHFLEKLIASSPSGIILLDFNSKIDSINTSAESIIGVESNLLIGKSLQELPDWLATELDQVKKGESKIIKNGVYSYKCHKAHFYNRGFLHHFISIEELTKEIFKTEKGAFEKVIRMMSHEINNSLGAINSILDSCLNYSNQLNEEDQIDYVNSLNVAIDRNSQLNQFMSNFAEVVRIPSPKKEYYDLLKIVENVRQLFNKQCVKKNIIWESELDDTSFEVEIDVQQITQALVNIVKNSIEAIDGHGKITIIANKSLGQLIIRDTGVGIPKNIEQKIFTPFFSSKKDGQGIGLAVIREILLNHQLNFSLKTHSNSITEFSIHFKSI